MNFEQTIDNILAVEKGFVDNPADHGGPTNFGITQIVARANGYDGAMQDMPVSLARTIYRNRYIVTPCFDKVALIDEAIAGELIDTGVNMGPQTSSTYLQRWLNAFNDGGSHYADVFPDGRIGDITLASLRAYCRWRGAEGSQVMLAALNAIQGERYLEIAEHDTSQRKFTYGWIRARVMQQGPS